MKIKKTFTPTDRSFNVSTSVDDYEVIGNSLTNSITTGSGNDSLFGGIGADTLIGGSGNDVYNVDNTGDVVIESASLSGGIDTVESTVNYTLRGGVENLKLVGSALVGFGNSLANQLVGNSLNNTLVADLGNDTLDGGVGADRMSGGDGNDLYLVDNAGDIVIESASLSGGIDTVETAVNYTLGGGVENLKLVGSALVGFGNSLANRLVGNSLNNTLVADLGNDTLDGGVGADRMSGGDGNDLYLVDNAGDIVIESSLSGGGIDTVESKSSYTLGGGLENLVLKDGAAVGVGNSANNSIIGTSLANTLDGGLGNDTLSGGDGNDYYIVDAALDSIQESSLAGGGVDTVESKASYSLGGGLENLKLVGSALVGFGNSLANQLVGNSLNNTLVADLGNDTLDGGVGADRMSGGDGNDLYRVDNAGDVVIESASLSGGIDTVETAVNYTLGGGVENLKLVGSALVGFGNSLANRLVGNSLNNTLVADLGNDTLDGGVGADRMSGGDGNDLYLVDNAGDIVIESSLSGGGIDTVESKSSYTLGGGLENLVLKDGAAVGVGNSANNSIIGTSLANTLDGGLGNDTLSGGDGNDYYIVDAALDSIQESSLAGGGVDTVESKASYSLGGGLENLKLVGSALVGFGNSLANQLVGNSLNNTLVADLGNDTLDGGVGADRMSGGDGNDLYRVDNAGDVVIESASLSGGIDTVETAVNYTLGGGVENLKLVGSALVGFGNSLANQLVGNSLNNTLVADLGNDTLDGEVGADRMSGGDGNDLYLVDNAGDIVIESSLSGGGIDTVESKSSYTLGGGLENLVLKDGAAVGVGNSANNSIVGTSLANTLDGGLGNDTLSGGDGNDYYIVDAALDSIQESSLSGGGIDTVESKSSYTLGGGLENLVLKAGATVGVGNSASNSIVGTSLANTLDGGLGNDTLSGGDGNDYYIVDAALDSIQESSLAGGGVDTVESKSSYTLGGGLENLVLKAGAAVGVGNSANNSIVGTSLANTLDGGLGNDTLSGGDGNDYYIVDAALDSIQESSLAGGGIDTVESKSSYTLGGGLENLVLKDGATVGVGNSANNSIIGTSLANTLDGGLGNDTLSGGDGNDYYIVDAALDSIQESSLAGGGVDTVESKSSYTLGGGLENLVLKDGATVGVGNSANNSIVGTSLANTLDGGLGNDTLSGGDGNDYYIVDAALDSIQESSLAGGGVDTVESKSSYTLGGGLENLVLKDGAAVGVGNSANNSIIGTSLANTLNGGLGNDTLSGGDGNDYYIVDAALDSIQESSLAGGGVDTVESKSSYTLGGGLENLVLKDGATVGVGNSANNSIVGTSLANTLDGGLGNDTLSGGDGNDYYIVDAALDSIQESSLAGGGIDTVESKSSYTLGGGLENLVLKAGATVGVGNSANNSIVGTSLANTLDGGLGNDTLSGGDGNDYYIVDAALDSIQESSLTGGGIDTVESKSSYTLGGGLENLVLKDGATVGVGNSANNSIVGTSLANTLDGGLGNDTLSGGDGNDYYIVDAALDSIQESSLAGGGVDTVESKSSYTLGGGLENLVLKAGAAVGVGNSANNSIVGTSLANTLNGGLGNDTLSGGDGNDYYIVDAALDSIQESSLAGGGVDTVESKSSYTLGGGLENLVLAGTAANGLGNSLANIITGNSLANRLDGAVGADTLIGNGGSDTFVVDNIGDSVVGGAGVELVESSVSYTLGANIENLLLTGSDSISATGNDQDNQIEGNESNNTIDGGVGVDSLIGGAGDDVYIIDNESDTVLENAEEGADLVEASVTFTLSDNVDNLNLVGEQAIDGTGNSLANAITGNSLENRIDGGAGDDLIAGGEADDTAVYSGSSTDYSIALIEGTDQYVLTDNREDSPDGIDTLSGFEYLEFNGETISLVDFLGNSGDQTLTGTEESEELTATIESQYFIALGGDDTINGSNGADTIEGGDGNDLIIGGEGADSQIGGAGDDTLVVNSSEDMVEGGDDIDTVESSVDFVLGEDLENLILTGEAMEATGNSLDNEITGNEMNNTLDGGDGSDLLIGGAGDDVYLVDEFDLGVVENEEEGTDLVISDADHILADNVENLVLTEDLALSGTGNSLGNEITGNSLDNILSGLEGDDILLGDEGADSLLGGEGSDSLVGGAGEDTLVVDDSDLGVDGGDDSDWSASTTDIDLADGRFTSVENILLLDIYAEDPDTGESVLSEVQPVTAVGDSLANWIVGNLSANSLDGGAGADTLDGGEGDDTLNVDADDALIDGGDGLDAIVSSIAVSLEDARFYNIENIELTGEENITATGDDADNVITGNSGDNTLDGGAGADILAGGDGDDFYIVDDEEDNVTENEAEGTDLVQSTVSFTLSDHIENLNLDGEEAIDGTGNSLGNVITGNSLDNRLDGVLNDDSLVGDTLIGGTGNDTFVVNSSEDMVEGGDDIDTVESSVDFVLGEDLENLILTGEAMEATGNSLDNEITGNEMNNTLDGGDGSDLLIGGAGDDVYLVDEFDLGVVENEEEGTDLVISDADHILADNVENLVLTEDLALSGTGNSLGNEITGNSLDNILSGLEGDDILLGDEGADSLLGGEGSDSLVGGAGEDTLVVDDSDLGVDGGDDSDWSASTTDIDLADGRFTSVENILLLDIYAEDPDTGESVLSEVQPVTAVGDSLANWIVGNLSANSLDGGAGADTLDGGEGDDTLNVDADDALIDGGDGLDAIVSSIAVSLEDARFYNIENIELTGEENITATGDDADNAITGNTGNNTLDGGLGADILAGGDGDDFYIVDDEEDNVTENEAEGTDLVQSTVSFTLSDHIENLNLDGEEAIDGTGNSLGNVITGNSLDNRLDGVLNDDPLVGDTLIGGAGNDTFVVNSSEDVVEGGDDIDTVESSVDFVLGENLENLLLTGEALSATGNSIDNEITGNEMNNTLDGGGGTDLLTGGAGDDVYLVDESDLGVVENEEEGTDLVISDADHILSDNVENLVLTEDLALSGTGNSLGNEITGNSLDNTLSGLEGDDILLGDEGADSLLGGEGSDSLVGGAGEDTLAVDDSDLGVDGGDDTDWAASTTDIDLADGRFTSVENILLVDIYAEDPDTGESVLSEVQPVTAVGDSLANWIVGNLSANSLDGGAGADTLDGGEGDDTLNVDADDALIDGGDGLDAIVSSIAVSLEDARFYNIENIELTGEENITATGDDADNAITGNSGDNTLDGGAGADYLDGGDGADSLAGGDGIDTLIGGNGNDTLVLDIVDYTGDTLNGALVDGGDGTDWVIANFNVSLTGGISNIEKIELSGSDTLTATGDDAANSIVGNSGANTLTGGGGLDTLTGGGDSDLFVLGDASNNYYGGVADENTFALVTDFTVGTDLLQLKGSLSDYTVDGTDPTQVLITSTDTSVGLVAKINIASGTASDVLNNAVFLS